MSPEQLRGQRPGRALGHLRPRHHGLRDVDRPAALRRRPAARPTSSSSTCRATPPAPSSLRPDLKIPREVDEVVLKMVAKDRDDRHADAAELRHHIDQAAGSPWTAARSRRTRPARWWRSWRGGLAALLATLLAADPAPDRPDGRAHSTSEKNRPQRMAPNHSPAPDSEMFAAGRSARPPHDERPALDVAPGGPCPTRASRWSCRGCRPSRRRGRPGPPCGP